MELETIYIVEKVMMHWGDGPMLREATFVLKAEAIPPFPDFRVRNSIGPWFIYAYDTLMSHREWSMVEVRGHIRWIRTYLELIPAPVDILPPPVGDIGIQYEEEEEEPMEEDNPNENNVDANMEAVGNGNGMGEEVEEEEKEEEDPKEDPNWVDEAATAVTPVVIVAEDPNHTPTLPFMNFNADLQIPASNRVEAEHDHTQWRDVFAVGEQPKEGRGNNQGANKI